MDAKKGKLLFLVFVMVFISACGSKPLTTTDTATLQNVTQPPIMTPLPPATPTVAFTPTPSPTLLPSWCPATYNGPPITGGVINVAYVKDGNLWFRTEDKDDVLLIQSGDVINPYLSDDGLVIVYTRGEDKIIVGQSQVQRVSLWSVRTKTGETKKILSADQITKMGNTPDALAIVPGIQGFIPNTHTLTLQTFPVYEGINYVPVHDFWRVYMDSGRRDQFPGPKRDFLYSPLGDKLSLMDMNGIDLYTAEGKPLGENLVPGYTGMGMGEYYSFPVQWARDGSALMALVPARSDNVFAPDSQFMVWRIPADSKKGQELGTFTGIAPSVTFSDDLRFMAFYRWLQLNSSLQELMLAEADGTDSLVYASGELINIYGWRPGTYQFVFSKDKSLWLGDVCNRAKLLFEFTGYSRLFWLDTFRYYYDTPLESTDIQILDVAFGSISDSIGVPEPLRGISAYSVKVIKP